MVWMQLYIYVVNLVSNVNVDIKFSDLGQDIGIFQIPLLI